MSPGTLTMAARREIAAVLERQPGTRGVRLAPGARFGSCGLPGAIDRGLCLPGREDGPGPAEPVSAHSALAQPLQKDTCRGLGGKGPIIVCDNIDWDEAIDGVLTQAFARKAEVCFAGTRLFVPSKSHDKFVTDLAEKAARIPLGNPLDVQTQLGPFVTAQRLTDILAQIETAKNEGVKVVCGGEKETRPDLRKGNFIRPTILTNVKPDLAVARDELFGPVLCVIGYGRLTTRSERRTTPNTVSPVTFGRTTSARATASPRSWRSATSS